ncbi:hypothetical protein TNCV_3321641 [Trichonephila clavipes]|nr:hypothetical protein TNCV_3321641 [Trichonephila clavipes]
MAVYTLEQKSINKSRDKVDLYTIEEIRMERNVRESGLQDNQLKIMANFQEHKQRARAEGGEELRNGRLLENAPPGVKLGMFVDDIIVWCSGSDLIEMETTLNNALSALSAFGSGTKLCFNSS